MTTTAKGNAADTILAIDLGKYKSVACIYRSADDHRFTTFPTGRAELTRLIEKHRPDVIGKFPSVAIPDKEIRETRGLIETRQKLVGRRVALQNRIRAVLV